MSAPPASALEVPVAHVAGDRRVAWMAAWLAGCLLLAYGFDIGHGFISDDFGWIAYASRIPGPGWLHRLFVETPMGFYRPLVSLSFLANRWLFDHQAMAYALTNLTLVVLTAAAIARLTMSFGYGPLAGLFAAGLWAFNMHGIGMALTWISGRTSLLSTLGAVLAAVAMRANRPFAAGACTLGALLSKEEPLLLPVVLAGWVAIEPTEGDRPGGGVLARAWRATWPSFAALAAYLALRANSTAMTPANAPPYYALSLAPGVVLPNLLAYLDRAGTFSAAILLLGVLIFTQRLPSLDRAEWRLCARGIWWAVLGVAVTLLVPVRSDLYACLPAVGVSLVAVAVGSAVWRTMTPARRPIATLALLALPLALLPIYRARNAPNRVNAELSNRLVAHVTQALAARDDLTRVEVYQSEGERPAAATALGSALPLAVLSRTGRTIAATIHDVPPTSAPDAPPRGALLVRLDRGEIVSVAAPR